MPKWMAGCAIWKKGARESRAATGPKYAAGPTGGSPGNLHSKPTALPRPLSGELGRLSPGVLTLS